MISYYSMIFATERMWYQFYLGLIFKRQVAHTISEG